MYIGGYVFIYHDLSFASVVVTTREIEGWNEEIKFLKVEDVCHTESKAQFISKNVPASQYLVLMSIGVELRVQMKEKVVDFPKSRFAGRLLQQICLIINQINRPVWIRTTDAFVWFGYQSTWASIYWEEK